MGVEPVSFDKRKRLSEAEKKRIRVKENTPLMVRVGKWFRRQEGTLWTMYEAEALEQIGEQAEGDVVVLEKYYTAKVPAGEDYRRRDLGTLLNNWNTELDRARSYVAKSAARERNW